MNQTCSASACIRSIIRLLLPLALSVLLPLQHAGAQALQLLVPAYFYPGGADLTYWNQLDAAATQAPLNVIFDPSSGPGATTDPNYTQAVTNVRAAGAQTFAYIDTDYGNRPLAAMEQDIVQYLNLYPNLESGFFLDRVTNVNSPADLAIYNSLYTFIRSLNSNFRVIGNPGTNAPEVYLTAPAVDTLVTFENDASLYPSYQPQPYMLNYSSSHFANIIYDQPTAAGMESDLAEAIATNAGYVYVTDGTETMANPNPYDTLPVYWNQEVATIHDIAAPESSTLSMAVGLLGLSIMGIQWQHHAARKRGKAC